MAITGALTTSAPAAASPSVKGWAWWRGRQTTIFSPASGLGA